jgi:hypothetical protein
VGYARMNTEARGERHAQQTGRPARTRTRRCADPGRARNTTTATRDCRDRQPWRTEGQAAKGRGAAAAAVPSARSTACCGRPRPSEAGPCRRRDVPARHPRRAASRVVTAHIEGRRRRPDTCTNFKAPTSAKPAQTRPDPLHHTQEGTTVYLPGL